VQTILALRSSALSETLLTAGGWRLVFREREAVVFVRETDANRALLSRLEQLSRDDRERSDPRAVADGGGGRRMPWWDGASPPARRQGPA
jgi:hypothetical protein